VLEIPLRQAVIYALSFENLRKTSYNLAGRMTRFV
jgi:hypothetical protein